MSSRLIPALKAGQPMQKQGEHLSINGGVCSIPSSDAGANLDVDVPWKYLNFFMDDDKRLKTIGEEYGAGRMFTGEVKKELIQVC